MKKILLPVSLTFLLAGCYSVSSLRPGVPVQEDKSVFSMGFGYQSPIFTRSQEDDERETLTSSFEDVKVPVLDLSYQAGWSEKVDWGWALKLPGPVSANVRYGLTEPSLGFNAAIGGSVGYASYEISGLSQSFVDLEVPLYLSYHLSPRAFLFLTPRMSLRMYSLENREYVSNSPDFEYETVKANYSIPMTGVSVGGVMPVGHTMGLAAEVSYFNSLNLKSDSLIPDGILQVMLGIIWGANEYNLGRDTPVDSRIERKIQRERPNKRKAFSGKKST